MYYLREPDLEYILDQFPSDEQFGGQPIYSLLKAPELAMFMVWTRAWYSWQLQLANQQTLHCLPLFPFFSSIPTSSINKEGNNNNGIVYQVSDKVFLTLFSCMKIDLYNHGLGLFWTTIIQFGFFI